ncbi:MAG: SDR family NAD(P)-dependent oxidoreductase [Xanthobacteraceae bacterium]|uniref:SDR family NAD(P)-dependent oxidoreductase n=1 Tax=Pseudolabrys sp. TaxID=1960880 RepID=UPI003D126EFF
MDFAGRHVIITGGAGALGTAVTGLLLEAGAHCRIPYRHAADAERFAYRSHERVAMIGDSDLADEAAVTRLYDGVPSLWASIQLAGGFAAAPFARTSKTDFTAQIETNLTSCFLCCREAVRAMQRSGPEGANGGRIVNVAARPALEWRSGAGMAAYTAAKAGVAALTAALAEEVAKNGILVNAVAPSIMDTPANRKAMPKADFDAWPKVEEVAATIAFLASPDNRVSRGGIVPVYGKS